MAMKHFMGLWMDAQPDLVDAVARALCRRHCDEIYGECSERMLDRRMRMFECEARDAIALVRQYDAGLAPVLRTAERRNFFGSVD